MTVTLAQLAGLVHGRVVGDPTLVIRGANVPAHAQPGEITLVDRPERLKLLAGTRASAVVVPREVQPEGWAAIVVEDVHQAFAEIICGFRPPHDRKRIGVSPAAHVSAVARIAPGVDVYPGAVIEDDVEIASGATIYPHVHVMAGSRIGENVTIFTGAVLYEGTIVGPRVIVHAHAVIGCYGFGYAMAAGKYQRAAQLGYVEIAADVEIGAGTTIDRGAYGPTVIGEGTKIDNQVQIAHNCQIGRHNLLCSQVGIAGSTSTGDFVVMAGQVGVRDHVHIGERAVLGAKAGVSNDVPPKAMYFGCPATTERHQKLLMAAQSKLPEMRRELRALARTVAHIEALVAAPIAGDEERPKASAA
jgi:UDP-3-O-[3-hydroxymyristoyl] glucosamine N-acyltransferase